MKLLYQWPARRSPAKLDEALPALRLPKRRRRERYMGDKVAMNGPFDKFTDHLQQEINEEVIQTYGKQVYERWRNPRFWGRMERPTGYSCVTGSCGDTVEFFLRVKQGVVLEASFTTTGCGSSAVCASVACELAVGKTAEDAKNVTGEMILEVLEGLPEDNVHCAFLAAETLKEALDACAQPE